MRRYVAAALIGVACKAAVPEQPRSTILTVTLVWLWWLTIQELRSRP